MADTFSGVIDVEDTVKDLEKLIKGSPKEFGAALYQEAQVEVKEIIQRTPWDTGALRGTIHVTEPQYEKDRIFVEVVAGGPAAPYALIVHEDLEALHEHGEAKYIERPLKESAPHMPERLAKRIDLNRVL